jgi:hypothetical protein
MLMNATPTTPDLPTTPQNPLFPEIPALTSSTAAAAPVTATAAQHHIKLTDEDILNLLDCAGYGINYWADSAQIDEDAQTYTVTERSDELPDDETPAVKTITFDELRTAFRTLADDDKLPDWQMREVAEGDYAFDASVGDLVVQWAAYGEITFG